jgi:DNA invertase Pin-like site-specific DNA recombinase
VIAAVYARKSTDQSAVADEAKSVARQIAHAKSYAERKGWTLTESCIFVDDGVSGAELEKRPGVQRLRAALKPRSPFQILIVSEQSRLSRDTSDTLQVLKELARAGVRVFGYQDDRAISLETPSDTLFTTVNAWKDSEARREASVRTYDALARKARASHVAGGRVFGCATHHYRGVAMCANGLELRREVVEPALLSAIEGEMPRDRGSLERRLREYLVDWKGLLQRHVAEARQMLEALLADRLVFTPTTDADGAACYRVQGRFAFGRILGGIIGSQGMASPAGLEPATPGLGNRCSILLSYGDVRDFVRKSARRSSE